LFSENFNRDARSASLGVMGVKTTRRFFNNGFEPEIFRADDFFEEKNIRFCYNTCPTPPVRVLWAIYFFADLKSDPRSSLIF
jgi:hypothetical protein